MVKFMGNDRITVQDQIQQIRDKQRESQRGKGTHGKRKHVKEVGQIDSLTASADRQKAACQVRRGRAQLLLLLS